MTYLKTASLTWRCYHAGYVTGSGAVRMLAYGVLATLAFSNGQGTMHKLHTGAMRSTFRRGL